MPKSSQHQELQDILEKRLTNWLGATIQEYPNSGHNNDVFAATQTGVSIYLEIIWTRSQFYADLSMLLESSADVKAAVVSPDVLNDRKLRREYLKAAISQRTRGTIMLEEMIDGQRILDSDSDYVEHYIHDILDTAVEVAEERPARTSEKPREEREDAKASLMEKADGVFTVTMGIVLYGVLRIPWFLFGFSPGSFLEFDPILVVVLMLVTIVIMGLVWVVIHLLLRSAHEFFLPWRRIVALTLGGYVLVLVFLFLNLLLSLFYPDFLRGIVFEHWEVFLSVFAGSTLLTGLAALILESMLPWYLRRLKAVDPLSLPRIDPMSLDFPHFRPISKVFSRKKPWAILLLVIVVSSSTVVGLDLNLNIFTPGVTYGPTGAVVSTYNPKFGYIGNLTTSLRFVNESGTCLMDTFQPVMRNVTIIVPLSPALSVDSISLPDPSAVSNRNITGTSSGTYASYLYNLEPGYTDLYIAHPSDIKVDFGLTSKKDSIFKNGTIIVDLSNASRHSQTELTLGYSLPKSLPISCVEKITYISGYNGTAGEEFIRHDFTITNDAVMPFILKSINLNDYVYYGSNRTSQITFLVNGKVDESYGRSSFNQIYLGDYPVIAPGNTTTLSFYWTNNPT